MHYQHRSGAPTRPHNDHHTRWERPEGQPPLILAVGVLAMIFVIGILLIAAV